MNIKAVIQSHGWQIQDLAKEMKIKQGTLSGMITGNPTVKSLNLIAKALGCSVAEFFMDELPEDFDFTAWRNSMTVARNKKQDVNDLPFEHQKEMDESENTPGVFVCPHCGAGVSFGAFVVNKPKSEEETL